jgi:hypothetical protein
MARTPPEVVLAAAAEHGLRNYQTSYRQAVTFVFCLIEGMVVAGFLFGVVVTLAFPATGSDADMPAPAVGSAPGVPWGTVVVCSVLTVVLIIHIVMLARNRVYYVFLEGVVSTNFRGRPRVAGRWADLSIDEQVQATYVNGGYAGTLVHYRVVDRAMNRLIITARRGSEQDSLLQTLLHISREGIR